MTKETILIYLPAEMKHELELLCRLHKKSIARIGKEIVEQWINDQKDTMRQGGYDFEELNKKMEDIKNVCQNR